MQAAFLVVLAGAAASIVLAWGYFRRYHLPPPSLGVMSLGDVAVMMAVILVVPYLYLLLPLWLIIGIFAVGIGSVILSLWGPVLHRRGVDWLVTLILVGGDFVAAGLLGVSSPAYVLLNDVLLILATVGTTNLWAQSGMKARDVAVLALFLAVYDLIATSLFPLTDQVLHRLAQMPLTPELSWGAAPHQVGLGLGDLLLATIFPLVMGKAFGPAAAAVAMVVEIVALALMMIALALTTGLVGLPAMTALGPLMAIQYAYWRRRRGAERTLRQFRGAGLGPASLWPS